MKKMYTYKNDQNRRFVSDNSSFSLYFYFVWFARAAEHPRYVCWLNTHLILFDIAEQGPQRPSDQLPESCCEPKLLLYIFNRTHFQQFLLLFGNFWVKYVDWLRIIVQARRLRNDRYRTKNTGQCKQP